MVPVVVIFAVAALIVVGCSCGFRFGGGHCGACSVCRVVVSGGGGGSGSGSGGSGGGEVLDVVLRPFKSFSRINFTLCKPLLLSSSIISTSISNNSARSHTCNAKTLISFSPHEGNNRSAQN